jgi:hypothetical protein
MNPSTQSSNCICTNFVNIPKILKLQHYLQALNTGIMAFSAVWARATKPKTKRANAKLNLPEPTGVCFRNLREVLDYG